jgi:hypothetical protein
MKPKNKKSEQLTHSCFHKHDELHNRCLLSSQTLLALHPSGQEIPPGQQDCPVHAAVHTEGGGGQRRLGCVERALEQQHVCQE